MSEVSSESNQTEVLQPGQVIRPQTNEDVACHLVEKLYGLKVKSVKELVSYDDRNYMVTVESEYNNPYIEKLHPHGYMCKILNSMDSKKNHVDAEHAIQKILLAHGFNNPQPVKNIHGNEKHLEKIYTPKVGEGWVENNDSGDRPFGHHLVRLLTYTPGQILHSVPYTTDLFYQAGKYIAGIEKALKGFTHTGYEKHETMWNLISTPKLVDFLYAVQNETDKELVNEVIDKFKSDVVPNVCKFQYGVIHGDFNEQNILVQKRSQSGEKDVEQYDICGVIDFGDSMYSYYVFEVAITICYMSIECECVDSNEVAGHVLAGYLTEIELNKDELDVLKTCIAARYCQSLVMGAYSYSLDPGNEYLLVTAKKGWAKLRRLWTTPEPELRTLWSNVIETYKLT